MSAAPPIQQRRTAPHRPNFASLKINLLSGLTVSLAMVPAAITFALMTQVEPLVGLYAPFFLAFISAAIGGLPGLISGATGALAVVMVPLAVQHGAECLFDTVVLMGIRQILFALARQGKFLRMVPHEVELGNLGKLIPTAANVKGEPHD